MPYAAVNGQRIYYQDTGGDGAAFDSQIEAFADGLSQAGFIALRVLPGL
jgi:hypothetical protein